MLHGQVTELNTVTFMVGNNQKKRIKEKISVLLFNQKVFCRFYLLRH